MKTLRLTLDRTIESTLQYHNKSVQIMSNLFGRNINYPIEFEHGLMRFTLDVGELRVRVCIDINDMCDRLITLLTRSLQLIHTDPLHPIQVCNLQLLSVASMLLSNPRNRVYWFEWKSVFDPDQIERYLKLHRFAGYSDTVHNCMFVLSVLNDCYKMEYEAEVYEDLDYPSLSKSAIPNDLAEYFYTLGTATFPDGDGESSECTRNLIRWTTNTLNMFNESYHTSVCSDFNFTLSYQRANHLSSKQMVAYQIIREVISVLSAMPIDYDYECTPVRG